MPPTPSLAPSLAPRWSTSSLGEPATPSEQDKRALVDHLCLCSTQRGPLQTLGVGIGWLHALLAGRAVTLCTLAGLLVLGGWLVR